jgi:hypothetical protein
MTLRLDHLGGHFDDFGWKRPSKRRNHSTVRSTRAVDATLLNVIELLSVAFSGKPTNVRLSQGPIESRKESPAFHISHVTS